MPELPGALDAFPHGSGTIMSGLIINGHLWPRKEDSNVAAESIGSEQLALGVRRTAKAADVSESTIRRAIRRGDLKFVRIGRRVVIPYESLRAFLEKE